MPSHKSTDSSLADDKEIKKLSKAAVTQYGGSYAAAVKAKYKRERKRRQSMINQRLQEIHSLNRSSSSLSSSSSDPQSTEDNNKAPPNYHRDERGILKYKKEGCKSDTLTRPRSRSSPHSRVVIKNSITVKYEKPQQTSTAALDPADSPTFSCSKRNSKNHELPQGNCPSIPLHSNENSSKNLELSTPYHIKIGDDKSVQYVITQKIRRYTDEEPDRSSRTSSKHQVTDVSSPKRKKHDSSTPLSEHAAKSSNTPGASKKSNISYEGNDENIILDTSSESLPKMQSTKKDNNKSAPSYNREETDNNFHHPESSRDVVNYIDGLFDQPEQPTYVDDSLSILQNDKKISENLKELSFSDSIGIEGDKLVDGGTHKMCEYADVSSPQKKKHDSSTPLSEHEAKSSNTPGASKKSNRSYEGNDENIILDTSSESLPNMQSTKKDNNKSAPSYNRENNDTPMSCEISGNRLKSIVVKVERRRAVDHVSTDLISQKTEEYVDSVRQSDLERSSKQRSRKQLEDMSMRSDPHDNRICDHVCDDEFINDKTLPDFIAEVDKCTALGPNSYYNDGSDDSYYHPNRSPLLNSVFHMPILQNFLVSEGLPGYF